MKFKKPKFWDYKKPNLISYILLPFTFPLIINNFLLNFKKVKKNKQIIKKICIGNIYIGGTAKTPLTIKICKILNNLNLKTATIKKYHGILVEYISNSCECVNFPGGSGGSCGSYGSYGRMRKLIATTRNVWSFRTTSQRQGSDIRTLPGTTRGCVSNQLATAAGLQPVKYAPFCMASSNAARDAAV